MRKTEHLKRRRYFLAACSLALAWLIAPAKLPAQTATGAISGTVTDPKGLAMAEATVSVHNVETGAETSYPTNSSGLYVAPYLQPGRYEVTASKSGFETVVHKGIVVHVGDPLTVDIQLPVQLQTTSVIVTEEAPLLETSKTGQSQTVSGGRASWLARNPFNLPNFTNIDFRVARAISFKERYRLDFSVDAFNLFNSTIVSAVNTTAFTYSGPGTGACAGHTNGCLIPSGSFRSISTTAGALYGARQLQFGARFTF